MTISVAGFTAPGSILKRNDVLGIDDVVNPVFAKSSKPPRLTPLKILYKSHRFQMFGIDAPGVSTSVIKNLPVFEVTHLDHEHVPVSQSRTVDRLGQFSVTALKEGPQPLPTSSLRDLKIGFWVWGNGSSSTGRPSTHEALIMLTTHTATQEFIPVSTLTIVNKTCRYHDPNDTTH